MFESVLTLQAEFDELQSELADPELHSNPARSKKVNRRYAELPYHRGLERVERDRREP